MNSKHGFSRIKSPLLSLCLQINKTNLNKKKNNKIDIDETKGIPTFEIELNYYNHLYIYYILSIRTFKANLT